MKTVIFDFDGTIADTLSLGVELLNSQSDRFGLKKFTNEEVKRFRGMEARQIMDKLHLSVFRVLRIGKVLKLELNNVIDTANVFSGMKEALEELKKEAYKLGIVSLNNKENILRFLQKNNLEVFDYIYCKNTVFGKDKLIRKMIRKEKMVREETIFIGDEVRDIEAAKQEGIKIISTTWGYNTKEVILKHNTLTVDKPSEIPSAVKENL